MPNDLETYARKAKEMPRQTLSALIQAYQTAQQLPDVLKAAGQQGNGLKNLTGPQEMSWRDLQAWANSQVDAGVGYWRGYLQPKLQDLLRIK